MCVRSGLAGSNSLRKAETISNRVHSGHPGSGWAAATKEREVARNGRCVREAGPIRRRLGTDGLITSSVLLALLEIRSCPGEPITGSTG